MAYTGAAVLKTLITIMGFCGELKMILSEGKILLLMRKLIVAEIKFIFPKGKMIAGKGKMILLMRKMIVAEYKNDFLERKIYFRGSKIISENKNFILL